jgi:hypothetical protein
MPLVQLVLVPFMFAPDARYSLEAGVSILAIVARWAGVEFLT